MISKFFVQFVPEWGYHDKLRAIKAARVTQLRPIKTVPNAVVIKLEVDLPESLFTPVVVTAVVNDTNPDELVATADHEAYNSYADEGFGGT